jgi:hypothetical protein
MVVVVVGTMPLVTEVVEEDALVLVWPLRLGSWRGCGARF